MIQSERCGLKIRDSRTTYFVAVNLFDNIDSITASGYDLIKSVCAVNLFIYAGDELCTLKLIAME